MLRCGACGFLGAKSAAKPERDKGPRHPPGPAPQDISGKMDSHADSTDSDQSGDGQGQTGQQVPQSTVPSQSAQQEANRQINDDGHERMGTGETRVSGHMRQMGDDVWPRAVDDFLQDQTRDKSTTDCQQKKQTFTETQFQDRKHSKGSGGCHQHGITTKGSEVPHSLLKPSGAYHPLRRTGSSQQ